MNEILGICVVVTGMIFNIIGCIGLVRFPDIYNRLQAGTKCVTLGTCLLLAGCMILSTSVACTLKCLVCAGFILITLPTGAHALARGSHAFGVKLADISVTDHYERDKRSGKEVGKAS